MRVKELGSRQAPSTIREFLSRMVRPQGPVVKVERQEVPYYQQQGWSFSGNVYQGSYKTPYGSFVGRVEQRGKGQFEFFLYMPSEPIQRHSHWTCFAPRGNGWYLVHMGKQPKDISSGILTIERLITEAYEN